MLGKLANHMQKSETELLFYAFQKINSKCVKDLYVKSVSVKLLEGNRRKKLLNTGLENSFLNMMRIAKNESNKSKNIQVGLHQTKQHLHRKTISKIKRQLTNGRK